METGFINVDSPAVQQYECATTLILFYIYSIYIILHFTVLLTPTAVFEVYASLVTESVSKQHYIPQQFCKNVFFKICIWMCFVV